MCVVSAPDVGAHPLGQPSALSTAARTHALPSGKNALHWALCEGAAAEQRQLRLLHLDAGLAAQPDQGGNLPLHYAASTAA